MQVLEIKPQVAAQHFFNNIFPFYTILSFKKNNVYMFVSFCPKKDSSKKTDHADSVTMNLHLRTKNQDANLSVDGSLSQFLLIKLNL